MTKFGIALAIIASSALAQESGPGGTGRWSFEEYIVSVVEVPKGSNINVHNIGDVKVIGWSFPNIEECQEARNIALNPSGFSVPLGTGGGAQAHIGRSVSVCFRQ